MAKRPYRQDEDDEDDEGIQAARPQPRARRDDDAEEDSDEPRRRRRREEEDEDDDYEERPRRRRSGGGGIIPYRNGMALAGYYCSFLGLIAILGSFALAAALVGNFNAVLVFGLMYGVGGISAVLGIIFGSVGLATVSRNPEARGTAHAVIGIVLGGLEILGLILIVLGAFAIRR